MKRPASMPTDRIVKIAKHRPPLSWFEGPSSNHKLFLHYAPRVGDVVQLIPLAGGRETAVITCVVVNAKGVDMDGVLVILKFLCSEDEKLSEWAEQHVTGSVQAPGVCFRFCQHDDCVNGDVQTMYVHKWRIIKDTLGDEAMNSDEGEPAHSDVKGGGLR